MNDPDDPTPPTGTNLKKGSAAVNRAWEQLLQEQAELAEDRRSEGWSVTTVEASHTDPVTKDMGDHDRFGLMHVVSKSDGEAFSDAYDPETFTEFLAYASPIEGRRFGVTELIDPNAEHSILIAYEYPLERAGGLADNAKEHGAIYTHVKKIDGTILGTFEHENYEPLLPIPPASDE